MSNNNLFLGHAAFHPYQRFGIGFDRLFDELDRLLHVNQPNSTGGYPPFNLERTSDNTYRITMAVAGFSEKEIDLTQQENTLSVVGQKQEESKSNDSYLHRGLATRDFKREFVLGDRVIVKAASLKDGILVIELEEIVPEQLKAKKIPLIKG